MSDTQKLPLEPRENEVRDILILLMLMVGGVGVGLLLGEVLVRVFLREPSGFFVQIPNQHRVFNAQSDILPGVEGPTDFVINSRGVRGDELDSTFDYQIMAVGGSTTECLYLDQEKAWPYRIQSILNDNQSDSKVWVGNIGKSGICTREHCFQLPRILPDYPDLDVLIFLVGFNDVMIRLTRERFYDPHFAEKPENYQDYLQRSFSVLPSASREEKGFPFRWKLFEVTSRVFNPPVPHSIEKPQAVHYEDEAAKIYVERRRYRREAPNILTATPDLTSGLGEYERNLNRCIDEAEKRSVRVILLTQPVLWHKGMSEELEQLLWTGGLFSIAGEGLDYYAKEVLIETMEAYNNRLKKVALDRGVELIDLEGSLPKDTTVFYDDCHFNDGGSEKVAEIVAEYLLSHPPFHQSIALSPRSPGAH